MTGTEWKHEHSVSLPASPSSVFAALTDPAQLQRWFAERVKVEPRQGGAFRFWGRHTYGAPKAGGLDQRITRFEPDHALAFEWPFAGATSEVTLELEAEPPKESAPQTRLRLRHSFSNRLDVPYPTELVDDLWRLTLGNLDAHLRGGDAMVLPDYTDASPEIRLSIVIDAPKERVFCALIEPESIDKWMGGKAAVDPRVGGVYTLGWKYTVGEREVAGGSTRILELVENQRLVTDWVDWRGDTTRPPTRLTYLLESQGAKTKVTLVHSGFSRTVDQSDYPFGWRWFLEQLRKTVESGS